MDREEEILVASEETLGEQDVLGRNSGEEKEDNLGRVGAEGVGGAKQGTEERTAGVLSTADEASLKAAVLVACQLGPVVEHKRRRHGAVTLPSVSTVRAMLHEAVQSAAVTFGTRAAEEWADGFVFKPAIGGRDATLLKDCGGDFVQLCAHKRAKGAQNQLSVRRVRTLVAATDLTNPQDLERLVRIAEGLRINRKYKEEVAHAVNNKLLFLQWDKDTVLLLPTEIVAGLSRCTSPHSTGCSMRARRKGGPRPAPTPSRTP